MIPGELFLEESPIEINKDQASIALEVINSGDRPIQVGSHFHFYMVNDALIFDRAQCLDMRLDIPSGTAVRFEPGQTKTVKLIKFTSLKQGGTVSSNIKGH